MAIKHDEFSRIFREEHREVRDALLDLIAAFQDHDHEAAARQVGEVNRLAGPHFRYEEERLYPALVPIFGPDYVGQLLDDHDGAIAAARRLAALSGQGSWSDAEVEEAVGLARGLLPHVSDCDGLSIMVERLPEDEVEAVFEARESSRQEDLTLLEWAETVRERGDVAVAGTA